MYDVATAIDAAWGCRILQRDVTPRNFGHFNQRGVLFDFSVGQVGCVPLVPDSQSLRALTVPSHATTPSCVPASSVRMLSIPMLMHCTQEVPEGQPPGAQPGGFTGTLRWAPLDVLAGHAHTVSSQLEGLFISLHSISAGGNELSRIRHANVQDARHWASCRMYQFASVKLGEEERIEPRLLLLVSGLHNLFWPLSHGKIVREHRTNVTKEEVQDVCLRFFSLPVL